MPHLVFCGRYWRLAGDELSLPTICAVVGRVIWTCFLLIILSITTKSSACSYGLTSYLSVSILLFVSSILCEVSLIRISLQGSMVETHRRSGIGKVLLLHIILGILEFCCAVFGLVVIANRVSVPCTADIVDTTRVTVILLSVVVFSQLIDIAALLCCCYLFSANKVNDPAASEPLDEEWANSAWERRCRTVCKSLQVCTCNIFGGSNATEDLEKVAKILTAFFHHEGFLDVVPSDVVAGILLVRMQQRAGAGGGAAGGSFGHSPVRQSNHNLMSGTELLGLTLNPNPNPNLTLTEQLGLSPVRTRDHAGYAELSEMRRHLDGHPNPNPNPNAELSEKRRHLDGSNIADLLLLRDISHYSVYAMSIYTHLMLLFVNPCSGVCQLCQSLFCRRGCPCSSAGTGRPAPGSQGSFGGVSRDTVRGDSCFGINEAAVSQMTKKYNSELIFAAFENSVHVKPYAIFLDHEKQQTILTIRGTISLEDWISDGLTDSVELKDAGELWGFIGEGRYGHEGFVAAALRIRKELEENHMLKSLFSSGISPMQQQDGCGPSMHTPLNADTSSLSFRYPLVVVGHSLGAGIAVLLTLFLRQAHPDVQCFGFGMPGAVVDDTTARECSSFVTAVILGSDMVPRMTFPAMSALREQVLDAISRARVNKAHIMQTIFRDFEVDAFLHRPGQEPPSKFRTMTQKFTSHVNEKALQAHPLVLPGRIIHYAKHESGQQRERRLFSRACCRTTNYRPYETSWEAFSELKISPTMLIDHFIDKYVAETTRYVDQFKGVH